MRYFTSAYIITLLCFFAVPLTAAAHPYGESFEKQTDEYLIDIGYNVTDFIANSSTLFEFDLLDGEELAEYEDVWVRISKGNQTVLATGVNKSDFGGARLTFVFPEPGEYEFSVRYQEGTDALAEATFPINVQRNPRESGGDFGSTGLIIGAGFAGLIVGAGAMRLIARRQRAQT